MDIKPGDVVFKKAQYMTVTRVFRMPRSGREYATCQWFVGSNLYQNNIPIDDLEKAEAA